MIRELETKGRGQSLLSTLPGAKLPFAGARASGKAFLFAEGCRYGHFFGFVFLTADFVVLFFALLLESPAAPSPALRPLPKSALAAR